MAKTEVKVTNPITALDYPDVDVIRVGDVYYMVSTTMHFMPGCEILRSFDLAEWEHAAYVYDRLDSTPGQRLQGTENIYGKGMWAASLRFHQGRFYICFVANDTHKTYLFTAEKIEGPWEKRCIDGFYHDASLLFDDDGKIYIAYGNRDIYITELKPDLSGPLEGGLHRLAVSDAGNPLLGYEGTHFYKINGKYYLFMIHSRRDRWMRTESCFMADAIDGEFTGGDVLEDDRGYHGQGVAQGGIVDTPEGLWYGILFQDSGAVGRIPVLIPVAWEGDRPVFGEKGRIPRDFSVSSLRPGYRYEPLVQSDDFRGEPERKDGRPELSEEDRRRLYGCFGFKSAWQFNHEPDLSLVRQDREAGKLWITTGKLCQALTEAPNMLTQRMSYPGCTAEVTVDVSGLKEGDYAGICALQGCWAMAAVTKRQGRYYLVKKGLELRPEEGRPGHKVAVPGKIWETETDRQEIRLKVEADFTDLRDEARFYYLEGEEWKQMGEAHKLYFRLDHFTGCRIGLFAYATEEGGGRAGFGDFVYQREEDRMQTRESQEIETKDRAGEAGPRAPRDPEKKRSGFYLMRGKEVEGAVQPDGRGVKFLFMDGDRMVSAARLVGNVTEEAMLRMLRTAGGFRSLVHSIGVTAELERGESQSVDFVFQMYGKRDTYTSGTQLRMPVPTDGREQILLLEGQDWSEDDAVPGQFRFEFPRPEEIAVVSVKLYLQDGYEAPPETEELPVDLESAEYREMLEKSLMQTGDPARLQRAIDRARQGEEVTIAFIGGSITQGAGAVPINTGCYAYKIFERFCRLAGRGTEENVRYIKAGVGGTPSELGMLRYERDVLRDGSVEPDIVVVEFAVNDEGDETKGECYDSLVRKILGGKSAPAVILLFAVFDNDWNLQERLSPVGRAYGLPMVSVRDAVVEQFYKKPGQGRVFSKNQFFYDCYHPTNLGHTVMADCVDRLFRAVDGMPRQEDSLQLWQIPPVLGGEFEKVRLFDRSMTMPEIRVDCGDFSYRDEELQGVEMDRDLAPTPEFPHNWMRRADAENEGNPFTMEITCSALLLIFKDSGSSRTGCAKVFVDGREVLTADPHLNGWTHCNPVICFRGAARKQYHVEVRMAEGDEEKEFTILGFGYVE